MGVATPLMHEKISEVFPRDLEVGDICELHPEGMLSLKGWRWKGSLKRKDHTLVEIVGVPGSRSENIRYRKISPKPMGNGRADRKTHRSKPKDFERHYRLVEKGSL